jgi:hypothetical protein
LSLRGPRGLDALFKNTELLVTHYAGKKTVRPAKYACMYEAQIDNIGNDFLAGKPTEVVTFKSREDVFSLFPKDYKFVVFDKGDSYTGSYELVEMNRVINFGMISRYDVVAYPAERETQILHRTAR